MTRKKIITTFVILVGVQILFYLLIDIQYLMTVSTSVQAWQLYYYQSNVFDLVFSNSFVFAIILFMLNWDDLKDNRLIKAFAISVVSFVLIGAIFGVLFILTTRDNPWVPYELFGMNLLGWQANVFFIGYILSFALYTGAIIYFKKARYSAQKPIMYLVIAYGVLTYVTYNVQFGALRRSFATTMERTTMSNILGNLVGVPLHIVILFLLIRIVVTEQYFNNPQREDSLETS